MGRQTPIDLILHLLFPPRCVGCRRRGHWICRECAGDLPRLPADHCPMCVRPLAGAGVCPRCWRDPPEFDSLRCGFVFDGTVRHAIHQLKYRGAKHLAEPLALEMLHAIGHVDRPDVVVPVPLHPARFAQRGYNQAALLARIVGESLHAPAVESHLRRIRNTAAQVSLSGPERWQNVRGAFEATTGEFIGASILLIDDVATTGSTLRSAAGALKLAGARRVDAVVLARAL